MKSVTFAFVLALVVTLGTVTFAQEKPKPVASAPTLSDVQKLSVQNLAQRIELAQLKAQMAQVERSLLVAALQRFEGRAGETAKELQLPRKTFYDKLARHGLRAEDFRPD